MRKSSSFYLTLWALIFLLPAVVSCAAQQRDITELLGVTSTGQATMANSIPVVLASDQGETNAYATIFPQANYTTTKTSDAQLRPSSMKGAYLLWDLDAVAAGAPTITLYVDVYDVVGDEYTAIYQTDAQTTATMKKVLLYPGAVDTDAQLLEVCQLPLPHQWRVRIIPTVGGGTFSYTLACSYIP